LFGPKKELSLSHEIKSVEKSTSGRIYEKLDSPKRENELEKLL
jgi:hypothetical protein